MEIQNSKFKRKILKIVKKILIGETLSYRKVAKLTSFPWAWRAVGNILNKNYDSNVSCHRVIKSNGGIGGYN